MKRARLSIVAENQSNASKAGKLAKLISDTLRAEKNCEICKYEKFEKSYKLDFVIKFENPQRSIVESLEKTDRLCSPWNARLNRIQNEIELTFNRSVDTGYAKSEFNVIVWGNWVVID